MEPVVQDEISRHQRREYLAQSLADLLPLPAGDDCTARDALPDEKFGVEKIVRRLTQAIAKFIALDHVAIVQGP